MVIYGGGGNLVFLYSLCARRLLFRVFAPSKFRSLASPGRLLRSERLLASRRKELAQGSASGVLHAFRTDGEKTVDPVDDDNVDVSHVMSFGLRNADICHTAAFYMLRYLDLFNEVQTNRLHLAIPSALLGKRVKLHANSYFKNRAVYDDSMREQFPNVEWTEAVQGRAQQTSS